MRRCIALNQYRIKTAGRVGKMLLLQIMFHTALQLGQFGGRDAVGGAAETFAFAVFYFNKQDCVTAFDNQVDFAERAVPVARQQFAA